jgi:pyruvate carboxylase
MEPGSEVTIEIEPGKVLIVKFLTISDAHPDGTRTVFFELNGQPREVSIVDRSMKVEVAQRAKAEPGNPGQVGAPIPGAVTSITVGRGQPVKKGDRLLVMEAMKMQTTVYAPMDGKVQELLVQIGDTVEAKDLLAVIAH